MSNEQAEMGAAAGALRVAGCVDGLKSPQRLSGWAFEEGREDDTVEIQVFEGERLLGSGMTGRKRAAPRPACGFAIDVARPLSVLDVCSKRIRVFALDRSAGRHELPVWDRLIPEKVAASLQIDRNVGQPGGLAVVHPPVCVASDLLGALELRGTLGYVPEMALEDAMAALERDRMPLPGVSNRELYGRQSHLDYWLFGLEDCRKVTQVLQDRGVRPDRLLDFGGSTGRVFRHFHAQGLAGEVSGCDSNRVNVDWCNRYLPSAIRVKVNAFEPPLPFESESFDAVTAFSVFTHIDEFEAQWVAEMARVLRPGGVAYLTIHDETAWTHLPASLLKLLQASAEGSIVDPTRPLPASRLAFHSGTTVNVFHRQSHIRECWSRSLEVEEIRPLGHRFQAVVIARKRAA